MKYYNDESFLRAISQKMGGVPKEVRQAMMGIHECIKYAHQCGCCSMCFCFRAGDIAQLQKLLSSGLSPDSKDAKGISALHYAVGVNRLDILKALMDARADPKVC